MDEKSLIKKYQKEISSLRQELQQLKHGMMQNPDMAVSTQEDLVHLKLQLEAGQVKLQSRLEEEEEAKAALMGRIQRLTKLILVSTKNTLPSSIPERPNNRRRHSFGEDELAYLPDRKREYMIDDDTGSHASELSVEERVDVTNIDELVKDYKRNRKRGMLNWFKLRKPENLVGLSPNADSESSASGSPASCSKSSQNRVMFSDMKDGQRKSISRRGEESAVVDSYPERTQAGDLFSVTVGGRRLPPTGTTITDQMDLLCEQVKMLAGEVALCTSSLKRLSEQAASNPEDSQLMEHMQKLKDEISEKKRQIRVLEQRMIGSVETTTHTSNNIEMSKALSKLASQLNEKTFELEIKSADNRILQEQLQMKVSENAEMQETILLLRRQINSLSDKSFSNSQQIADAGATPLKTCSEELLKKNDEEGKGISSCEENYADENTPTSVMSLNRIFNLEDSKECNNDLKNQVHMQASEIENLKQEKVRLIEEKDGLEIQTQKLAEEASYAKELAGAAAVELRNLAEEVTKLSYDNAKLTGDLAAARESHCKSICCQRSVSYDLKHARPDGRPRKPDDGVLVEELQKELNARYQREAVLETTLSERDQIESELRIRLDEAKQHEEDLENELANMWVLVAKLRMSGTNADDISSEGEHASNISQTRIRNGVLKSNGLSYKMFKEDEVNENMDKMGTLEELRASYLKERRRCKELESLVSRLKFAFQIQWLGVIDEDYLLTASLEAIVHDFNGISLHNNTNL
uniref:Uncharacterized protein n=1 Tax=Fagus sylvatica TaxID=28930 RepID=A0A2N9F5H3_FAGSY